MDVVDAIVAVPTSAKGPFRDMPTKTIMTESASVIEAQQTKRSTMKVRLSTNFGDIVIQLDEEKAPVTVENFVTYVRDGHYDETIFHRVIPGFMVQGGGFKAGMQQIPTRDPIKNEADNGLVNKVGTVAMARTPDPHSASTQFFINVEDNDFLNFKAPTRDGWGYCVFGEVIDGMKAVAAMTDVPTGRSGHHQDVPREEIVLTKATVEED